MKTLYKCIAVALLVLGCTACSQKQEPKHIIVAYVTSGSTGMPDVNTLTHINYAFGHVNETFDGVTIDNPSRLKEITALKQQYPDLKVQLSVGGWGSGRFSEMAADPAKRAAFAKHCAQVSDTFCLDGIDIDWEYPSCDWASISASPQDIDNFTLLMKDLREALGKDQLLTLATVASGKYIDFKAIDPYIDFANIMTYDMSRPPLHHAPLYPSAISNNSCQQALEAHLAAGIPAHKLVLGMPFYGRGNDAVGNFIDYKDIIKLQGYQEAWSDESQAPYLADTAGVLVCSFDNPRSIRLKCDFIKANNLKGAMYWQYDGDDAQGSLRNTIARDLLEQ